MEQPTVSRFNSQSTSRTLVGSDNGIVSPILSPLEGGGQLPIVQTPDSKQWIDLEYLSPKIVKELRRQYDPSLKDEPSRPLAKSAAKVKAWMRASKIGIDIRLRHKLGPDHDEVTDIQLVPNTLDYLSNWRDEKQQLIAEPAELPAISSIVPELSGDGEIAELPDTSTQSELSGISVPSRASSDSTLGEPLPRYEPRQGNNSNEITSTSSNARTQSPERISQRAHTHSASQDSIVRTPTTGLNLRGSLDSDSDFTLSTLNNDTVSTYSIETNVDEALATNAEEKVRLEHGTEESNENQEVFQELQEVIKALRQQRLHPTSHGADRTQGNEAENCSKTEGIFRNLRVANRTTYETETDVEPPSPKRKPAKPARAKSVAMPRRKRSLLTPKKANKNAYNGLDENVEPEHDALLRKPTLPKRVPVSAGAEAMWKSLLLMQGKMLGAEHPLVYQAKSDLARSRANRHINGAEDLVALQKSRQFAIDQLGDVHPWVAAFSEDLDKLEKLTGCSKTKKTAYQMLDSQRSDEASSSYRRAEPEQAPSSPIRKPQEASGQLASSSPQPSPAVPKQPTIPVVPRIVTDLDNRIDLSHSPARNSSLQAPNADMLWSSSRPPHVPKSTISMLPSLLLGAFTKVSLNGLSWLQQNYGPEQPVEPGKVRVRWTCSCGAELHDDFVERRPGAARELERYLNRPRTMTGGNGTPTSPSSSTASRSFTNSSIGGPPSSQTSWSSYNFPQSGFMGFNGNSKGPQSLTGVPMYPGYNPLPEPPWLLTCANEERFTPKVAHLDMAPHKIRSDKDLALSLREHYFHVNKKWWRGLRMRGLTTIEFVQFEVHQNRFADIRKCPDMPSLQTEDYNFEPSDLLPPVSHYSHASLYEDCRIIELY